MVDFQPDLEQFSFDDPNNPLEIREPAVGLLRLSDSALGDHPVFVTNETVDIKTVSGAYETYGTSILVHKNHADRQLTDVTVQCTATPELSDTWATLSTTGAPFIKCSITGDSKDPVSPIKSMLLQVCGHPQVPDFTLEFNNPANESPIVLKCAPDDVSKIDKVIIGKCIGVAWSAISSATFPDV